MSDKTYNGWSNYETWTVKLWIDNEEGSYRYWQEQTEDIMRGVDYADTDSETRQLADSLKEQHEESLPELSGFASDLLNAAMSEVDWREIAESMIADYIENNPVEQAS